MTTLSEYKAMMEGATDDSVEQSYTFFHNKLFYGFHFEIRYNRLKLDYLALVVF